MAIPDYQTVMLPLLRDLADGAEHSGAGLVESLCAEFSLSDDERHQRLESGQQTVIANRAGWARTYLKKAGLIDSKRRGFFQITERGHAVLAGSPDRIDVKFLEQFPEFMAFRSLRHDRNSGKPESEGAAAEGTPEDQLDGAYGRLRIALEADLLDQVMAGSPVFFERLVVELLVAMGYGGSLRDAGQAVGKSGDGGIDGIIKEDRLGLDVIYIQAKRWEATVGRPELQKFAGALQGHRAKKGVFITTSAFSGEAVEYASRIDTRIVLIDGAALAKHMIDHNVGVSPMRSYEVKKIDLDYFVEE